MISLWDFLRDLRNVHQGFLAASLLMSVVASMTAGAAGTYVVVRGRNFVLDMVICAALPAAAVCLLLPGSPLLSSVAAVAAVVIITIFYRLLSVTLPPTGVRAAAFAVLGSCVGVAALVMAWRRPGNIVSQLAGSMRATTMSDLVVVTFLCACVLVTLTISHRFLVAAGFHRHGIQRLVWRATVLDATLGSCIALSIVALARPVGVFAGLVLIAVLPSVAWYLCRRVSSMILTAAGLGGLAAVLGVYAAWCSHLPQGPQVVAAAAALAVLVAAFSPLRIVAARWSVRRPGPLKRAAVSTGVPGSVPTGAKPLVVTVSADSPERGSHGGRGHSGVGGREVNHGEGVPRGRW